MKGGIKHLLKTMNQNNLACLLHSWLNKQEHLDLLEFFTNKKLRLLDLYLCYKTHLFRNKGRVEASSHTAAQHR